MIPFLLALPLATKITVAIMLVVTLFGAGVYQGIRIGEASCREAVIESERHTAQAITEQVLVLIKSSRITQQLLDRYRSGRGRY